jgi:osmoprotectant transport system permease protein
MSQMIFLFTASSRILAGEMLLTVVQDRPGLISRTVIYIGRRFDLIWDLLLEHLWLIIVSILIAVVVSVILGVIISYKTSLAVTVLTVCQIMMTIPSMAMLAFMVPLFGIGFTTGVVALILYSLLPIVRNTYTGIKEISPAVVESAVGMGMTEWRVLTKIKIPLARPVIMAGVRTATVMIVGIGAIAAYVGAGGLGELIFQGISRSHEPMIIVGAIGVSIIALAFDFVLSWGERRLAAVGKVKEAKQ